MEIKNNYYVNSLCGDNTDCSFEDGKKNCKFDKLITYIHLKYKYNVEK